MASRYQNLPTGKKEKKRLPGKRCAVMFCDKTNADNVHLYQFPGSDEEPRRRKWISFVLAKRSDDWNPDLGTSAAIISPMTVLKDLVRTRLGIRKDWKQVKQQSRNFEKCLPGTVSRNNSLAIMVRKFTSREFSEFTKGNGIKHTLVAPYHPRSNGQAERFVQTFKQFFKAEGSNSIKQSLARFLFSYRTMPNSTTGQTPAELFLNRRLRTRLDLIRPDLGRKVFNKQSDQKARHDEQSKE